MVETNGTSALQSAEQLSPDLTADYLEHHALMPLRHEAGRLLTATWAEVLDERALDDLRLIAGVPITLVKLPEADVRAAIRRTYSPDAMTAEGVIAGLGDDVGLPSQGNADDRGSIQGSQGMGQASPSWSWDPWRQMRGIRWRES